MVLQPPFGAVSGFVLVALTYLATKHGLSIKEASLLPAASLLSQWLKWIWAPTVDVTLTPRKWYLIGTITSAVGIVAMSITPMTPSTLPLLIGGRGGQSAALVCLDVTRGHDPSRHRTRRPGSSRRLVQRRQPGWDGTRRRPRADGCSSPCCVSCRWEPAPDNRCWRRPLHPPAIRAAHSSSVTRGMVHAFGPQEESSLTETDMISFTVQIDQYSTVK